MNIFLGINGIFFNLLFLLIIIHYFPKTVSFLLTGFVIRVFFLVSSNLGLILPDSTNDMVYYESTAWIFAQNGFNQILYNFPGFNKDFLSWILSILYLVTDRSIMLAQSASLFFGMGTIFLSYLATTKLWSDHAGVKVGWIVSLFPTQILYSILILREPYICFFLILGVYFFIIFLKEGKNIFLIFFLISISITAIFHGAMIFGAFAIMIFVIFKSLNYFSMSLLRKKLNYVSFFYILFGTLLIVLFFNSGEQGPNTRQLYIFDTNQFSFEKIKSPIKLLDLNYIVKIITGYGSETAFHDASYPQWMIADDLTSIIYLQPIRILYFLIGPMIWDITKVSHLFGVIDGSMYLLFLYFLIKYRSSIFLNRNILFIFIIFLTYIFIFSAVISNFGTSVRHRYKFLILLLIIIAPYIPEIKFSGKLQKKKINTGNY